jgi:hypothetical protein
MSLFSTYKLKKCRPRRNTGEAGRIQLLRSTTAITARRAGKQRDEPKKQQSRTPSQHGEPGKQHDEPVTQHSFSAVQQDSLTEQQVEA